MCKCEDEWEACVLMHSGGGNVSQEASSANMWLEYRVVCVFYCEKPGGKDSENNYPWNIPRAGSTCLSRCVKMKGEKK